MTSFDRVQTWSQQVHFAFDNAPGITLKCWQNKYPVLTDVDADVNSVVFIYTDSTWEGGRMLEYLAILCRKYAHLSEKTLNVHVIDPANLHSSDFLDIEKRYGHIGLGEGRGECYFLKSGSVVGTWKGLGYLKDGLEEGAQLQMLFESIYLRPI